MIIYHFTDYNHNPLKRRTMITRLMVVLLASMFAVTTSTGQSVTVTGTVSDTRTGDPLPGVNILVRGTTTGATTNNSGAYSINVSSTPAILVFSYVGYIAKEIRVTSTSTRVDVTLDEDIAFLNNVVVVGSRFNPRSEFDSPVPIDNLPVEMLESSGQLSLDQMMSFRVQSYNASQQTISDATAHFNPADLRGLGPSRTLVLINGKRKNPSSLVYINDTPGKGEVGVDMQSIPAAAVERIEVLRDGASAQYGSDAIAGVINIVTKDNVGLSNVTAFSGVTTEGDGAYSGFSANTGFGFSQGGYFNVTTGYQYQDRTNRAGEPGRDDLFGVGPENVFIQANPDLGMTVGQPKMTTFDVFYNSAIPLMSGAEIYSFGGVTYRNGESYALYRVPYWIPDDNFIFHDPGETYVGFQPTFETDIYDNTFAVGVRGDVSDWSVDVGSIYGRNTVDYTIGNSMNLDLGAQSPTTFFAGGYEFSNIVSNVDIFRSFDGVSDGELSVGAGTEFRTENFVSIAGEEASYIGNGVQSFPGIQPSNEVDKTRYNIGFYGTVDYAYEDYLVSGAVRFEDYSDFGNTFNWKVSGRARLADDRLVVRASTSTGFRAPSLHQIYLSNIQTLVSGGAVSNQGTFNNFSPVIRDLKVPSLKEEQSFNVSAGIAANINENATLTADYYHVEVDDRVVFTGEISNPDSTTIVGGILNTFEVTSIKFFTNAVDTKTDGVDVVLSYGGLNVGPGVLNINLAGNYNQTEITGSIKTPAPLAAENNEIFNRKEQSRIESARPRDKVILGVGYEVDNLSILLNNTRFGDVTWRHASDPANDQTFGARIVTDLSISYLFEQGIRVTARANNLLNVYPEEIDPKGDVVTDLGGRFRYPWEVNQFGFNGTTISGTVSYTF